MTSHLDDQFGYILQRKADDEYAVYDHGITCIQDPSVWFDADIFYATVLDAKSEMPPEYRELIDADRDAYQWVKVRVGRRIEVLGYAKPCDVRSSKARRASRDDGYESMLDGPRDRS